MVLHMGLASECSFLIAVKKISKKNVLKYQKGGKAAKI